MNKIKVLIADDHAVLRTGLRAAFELDEHIEVIGEASNGIEAIELNDELKADVIVMDIKMPKLDGIGASKIIKQTFPRTKILLLTMYDNKQFIMDALSSGIDGYVLKMSNMTKVLKAIRTIAKGDNYFDVDVTKPLKVSRRSTEKNFDKRVRKLYGLTKREFQIVNLIVMGYTSVEIATELEISINTVSNHRSNILSKLNLANTAELVKFALREGLIRN